METPPRSPDDISLLYRRLADQISAKNEADVRQVYKELLNSGEPLAAIVGTVMSSINRVRQSQEDGSLEPAVDELPDAPRVPAHFGHSAAEAPVEPPGADLHADGPDAEVQEVCGTAGDDRALGVWPAAVWVQAEAEQAAPDAPAPERAASNGATDLGLHDGALSVTTDDPPLVSAVGGTQSARSPSDLQLLMRLAMQRAQPKSANVTPEAEASERATVSNAAGSHTDDEDLAGTAGDSPLVSPADERQSARPGRGSARRLTARLLTVTTIVLTIAVAAAIWIRFFPAHQASSEHLATALQPKVVSPPTSPVAATATGPSGPDLLPVIAAASAALTEETRPAATSAGPVEKPTVDTSTVPPEAPVSPADASALLQRGDALLATGDVASARLFYAKAARAGDAMAALSLGESYDSRFLAAAGLIGVHGDQALATTWYRRARELGVSQADILLKSTEDRRD